MSIRLDSYYVTSATAGWLEGSPTVDDVVRSARSQLKKLWGDRDEVLVVSPQKVHNQRVCMAWLSSYTPTKDDDAHGSHLFVIWFEDKDPVDPLAAAMAHVNANGGWTKLAGDWWL